MEPNQIIYFIEYLPINAGPLRREQLTNTRKIRSQHYSVVQQVRTSNLDHRPSVLPSELCHPIRSTGFKLIADSG